MPSRDWRKPLGDLQRAHWNAKPFEVHVVQFVDEAWATSATTWGLSSLPLRFRPRFSLAWNPAGDGQGVGGAASPDIFRSLWWAEMRTKPLRTSRKRPLKCTTSWGRYSVEVAYETWAFCATICIELPSPFAAPFLYFPWLESSVSVTLGADDNLYIICRSSLLISLQALLSCAQCKLLLCNSLKDCWKNVWPLLQTPLLSLNL